ncbi:tyrosinase-like protein [Rhypophila decipiens]|uniref:Tyrosinase-like protein n=1 Tax=Rhypophila decipiens TaxID=261697 RepID=A0AAN6YF75_9PEZI|nr:tyrosinase-like protein [Rhypophila decipiens]
MLIKANLCLALAATATASFSALFDQKTIDSGAALTKLNALAKLSAYSNFKGSCNSKNVKIRQEWRTLSPAQRKNFIAAVKCLQGKPSILPPGVAPGSVSLFDDFEAIHINQTMTIHLTGTFLTWHRWFIYTYEKKLQQCGYNGNLPYWEWGFDVKSPRNSPVFDGSDTSLGSDGAKVNHAPLILNPPGTTVPITLQPGTGGGCVYAGPFKNMTTHLGPVILPVYGAVGEFTGPPTGNPFDDNPRCLKRDLNPDGAKRFTTFRNTTELILENDNIAWFQGVLQGDGRFVDQSLGVHGGGHFTIGGDPGSDAFISPGDPAFYLHHGQVDRVYWIWQMLDFANRKKVAGTNTFFDLPPSANTTVEDLIDILPLSTTKPKIKDLMNTVGGSPLCYVYV